MNAEETVQKLKNALQERKIEFVEEEPGLLIVELPNDDQVCLIADPIDNYYFVEFRGATSGFGFRMKDVDELIEQGIKTILERLPAGGNVH